MWANVFYFNGAHSSNAEGKSTTTHKDRQTHTHTCLSKRTQIKCQFIYLTCSIKQIAKIEMKNTRNKLQSVNIVHVKCSVYYPHIRSLTQFFFV